MIEITKTFQELNMEFHIGIEALKTTQTKMNTQLKNPKPKEKNQRKALKVKGIKQKLDYQNSKNRGSRPNKKGIQKVFEQKKRTYEKYGSLSKDKNYG